MGKGTSSTELHKDAYGCILTDTRNNLYHIDDFTTFKTLVCSLNRESPSTLSAALLPLCLGMPGTQCEVLDVGQYSDPTFGPF